MRQLLSFLFILLSISSYAQVHINDDGKTIVGNQNNTDAPSFTIGDYSTITTAKSYISNATKSIGLGISSIANTDGTWGIRVINHQNNTGSSIGLMTYPVGTSNKSSYGVKSYGGRTSSTAYGVYGGLYGTVAKGAGIYGSATSSALLSNTGVYAGYFNGDVYTTGNIYGTVLTRSLPNDQRGIVSVSDPDSGESSITDRISNLTVVQAFVNKGVSATEYANREIALSDSSATMASDPQELDIKIEENQEDITVVNSKSTGVRYGLDCVTLKELFPELVYEDSEGNTSINYIEMIPLLVQSIKELKGEVAFLKSQLDETSDKKTDTAEGSNSNSRGVAASIEELGQSDANTAVLGQNIPNPFSETTTIDLTVPKTVKNAYLFFYDMSGKEIKRMEITARGRTSVSIAGEDLTSGMYLYSLIADGKVISTKRMILAK